MSEVAIYLLIGWFIGMGGTFIYCINELHDEGYKISKPHILRVIKYTLYCSFLTAATLFLAFCIIYFFYNQNGGVE